MIKFFRNIRQNIINPNRVSRYILYALGEIILVVIGILIALQINNWNEKNQAEQELQNFVANIKDEFEITTHYIERYNRDNDSIISQLQECLIILKEQPADSLGNLKTCLGALGTDYSLTLSLPNTKALMNKGELLKYSSDSLAFYLQITESFMGFNHEMNTFIHDQYINSIEPFFTKKLNYSKIVLPTHSEGLIIGGPEPDYSSFKNDIELYNLLTFKLETSLNQANRTEFLLDFLNRFKKFLEKKQNKD